MHLFFARLDEKHNLLESFEKIFENFPKKIANNAFFHIFQRNLTNHYLIFCAFGRQTQIVGKFWENFDNFWWKFYWKIEFLFYFYFIFYFIFRKFVTKIRAFGNNTSFLQQFFRFRGGGFPLSPLATPLILAKTRKIEP